MEPLSNSSVPIPLGNCADMMSSWGSSKKIMFSLMLNPRSALAYLVTDNKTYINLVLNYELSTLVQGEYSS